MGVVVRRYTDILTIIINFPYSTCISSFFWQQHPYFFVHFKNVFSVFKKNKAKWRAPKLRYYGNVILSFHWKSPVEHDDGVYNA